jgi:hypothetical protein
MVWSVLSSASRSGENPKNQVTTKPTV